MPNRISYKRFFATSMLILVSFLVSCKEDKIPSSFHGVWEFYLQDNDTGELFNRTLDTLGDDSSPLTWIITGNQIKIGLGDDAFIADYEIVLSESNEIVLLFKNYPLENYILVGMKHRGDKLLIDLGYTQNDFLQFSLKD